MVVRDGHNSHIWCLLAVAISTWSLQYNISDLPTPGGPGFNSQSGHLFCLNSEAMWECCAGFCWSECCFSFWLHPLFLSCCFLDDWSPFWSFCLSAWGFHFGLSPLCLTFESFWICLDPPLFCFQACSVRIPSWISVNLKSAIAVTCKYIWATCSSLAGSTDKRVIDWIIDGIATLVAMRQPNALAISKMSGAGLWLQTL